MDKEQLRAMHARLGTKHRTFYDPRMDIYDKQKTADEPKEYMDDREDAYTSGHHDSTRFDSERGLENSTRYWQRNLDFTSRSPLNREIKKEKEVIGKLLKGPPPSRYQKQLGIAGISTPDIMKEKI